MAIAMRAMLIRGGILRETPNSSTLRPGGILHGADLTTAAE